MQDVADQQEVALMKINSPRPIYSGPLFCHEATANLDKESASMIAQTVNRLRERATILFIAHQLPEGLVSDHVKKMGAEA